MLVYCYSLLTDTVPSDIFYYACLHMYLVMDNDTMLDGSNKLMFFKVLVLNQR